MLTEAATSLVGFGSSDFVAYFEPTSLDQRIVNRSSRSCRARRPT
jgi:hypothetical protein